MALCQCSFEEGVEAHFRAALDAFPGGGGMLEVLTGIKHVDDAFRSARSRRAA